MKRVLLLVGAVCAIQTVFGQTTLTVDANGVLNSSKIVTQTTGGQVFFTGHQLGSTYSMPAGIFRAVTDNANGAQNYFYDGLANGVTTFSIRADGQGYFAGNVGIGTTTPQSKLEINNGSYTNDNQLIVSGAEATRYYGVMGITVPSGNTVLSFGTRSNNANFFETLNLFNGNVGIGKTNPQNKLDVNGTIHSKAVNVDLNGWSDYVFQKDYQLRPLSEVKAYIDQNQHLPEIPSEQEMIKSGLNVGEMNKLLMKKVEELTLYLIEMNKQLKVQENNNKKLEDHMRQLQESILKVSKNN